MSPGFLPAFFENLGQHAGDPAMLGADGLQLGMALNVGDEHGHAERDVAVDFLGDLQAVDLEPRLLQRIGQPFLGLAPFGLAEHAIDHGFIASLEALGEHGGGGEGAAGIEVDTGIAHALRAEILLQVGHRRIAHGHDNALVGCGLDQVVEGGATGMAHDLDAGRSWQRPPP